MKKYNYIITTGWWCAPDKDDREVKYGSNRIREQDFFKEWLFSIKAFCNPKKIIIIDSLSPIKPSIPVESSSDTHVLTLDHNPGHASVSLNKYSGVTYAHVLGMTYALLEDVDYWVYVEQDALLFGDNIVEYAIEQMRSPVMFGSGKSTPQPMQQSFMIIKKDFIPVFLKRLSHLNISDQAMSPEIKFAIASSNILSCLFRHLFQYLWKKNFTRGFCLKIVNKVSASQVLSYQDLPFGYGRARPVNFNEPRFYFQHGTDKELKMYHDKLQNRKCAD